MEQSQRKEEEENREYEVYEEDARRGNKIGDKKIGFRRGIREGGQKE